jgi:hypothetical protein
MSMDVSPLKSTQSEELRLKNYRTLLEQKNELELREIEAKHNDDVQRRMESGTAQIENLRRDFDVRFSQEAENLEERLRQTRSENELKIQQEKRQEEEELSRLKSLHQQRVEEYQKNSATQLDELHKQLQTTSQSLHDQAKKLALKERETLK